MTEQASWVTPRKKEGKKELESEGRKELESGNRKGTERLFFSKKTGARHRRK